MFAIDCETNGLDLSHGCKPFLVTLCTNDGENLFWEWDVDPITREPNIPSADIAEIQREIEIAKGWGTFSEEIRERHVIVGQNIRFDVKAMATIGISSIDSWPWEMTRDTLIAGHILASNQPHNLTDMVLHYLGRDIQPYEVRLEKVVKECRNLVRRRYPEWKIAKDDLPDMPSASEKTWKHDTWLPRCIAKKESLPSSHLYWTVLSEYANADSTSTLYLWKRMKELIEQCDLWDIFLLRMKLLPAIARLESKGITLNRDRMAELHTKYSTERKCMESVCLEVAKSLNYNLVLPKASLNHSLRDFCFGKEYLNLPIVKRTPAGSPGFDKEVVAEYLDMLPEGSSQRRFIEALAGKRKRDTALSYLENYRSFCLPSPYTEGFASDRYYILHPSINPTGTDHLRFSHNNPNSANIATQADDEGHSLRYIFGPAPDREWWSLDFKNIERRIPAYEAGEEEIIALFEHPDDPPYYGSEHALVSHLIYPELFEQCIGEDGQLDGRLMKKRFLQQYKRIKNGNFAIQYGAQTRKADATYGKRGAYDLLKRRFSKQEALNQHWIRYAEKHGYVETMPDRLVNPRRGYPIMCARTEYGKILPTVPLNYHVSGTAMWLMCCAMIDCDAQLLEWRKEGFSAWMVMNVHDELVFDLPRKADPRVDGKRSNLSRVKILQNLMERTGDRIGVPTPVNADYHPTHWGEGFSML